MVLYGWFLGFLSVVGVIKEEFKDCFNPGEPSLKVDDVCKYDSKRTDCVEDQVDVF